MDRISLSSIFSINLEVGQMCELCNGPKIVAFVHAVGTERVSVEFFQFNDNTYSVNIRNNGHFIATVNDITEYKIVGGGKE